MNGHIHDVDGAQHEDAAEALLLGDACGHDGSEARRHARLLWALLLALGEVAVERDGGAMHSDVHDDA